MILRFLGALLIASATVSASVCPTTFDTNTDCGYIVTIGPGDLISGVGVAGANGYEDGVNGALVGVLNNSGSQFDGAFTLTGNGIFALDGNGICTFIAGTPEGAYCSAAAAFGVDPDDYYGPLSTFSNYDSGNSGTVTITGLAAGATTFFSVEGPPSNIDPIGMSAIPEPRSWALLACGLGAIGFLSSITKQAELTRRSVFAERRTCAPVDR